jgi:hypothetical protein
MLTAPRVGATAPGTGAFGFIRTDTFAFTSWAGENVLSWSLPNRTIQLKLATRFQFMENNLANSQQMNAAGTAVLDLWKINNRDELHSIVPLSIETPSQTNLAGKKALVTIQDSAAADGAYCLYGLTTGTVNGTYNAFQFACAASAMVASINTTKAGGIAVLRSAAPSDGYAVIGHAASGKAYSTGVHGPADEFRIDSANDFTSSANPDLAIVRATKQTKFGGSAKLKSYTVATLPGAGTAGAGSLVFVSNASGGACIACSDGTSWKRINLGSTVS